jgi:p-aminobenzoyl-glutamate transporter AbgT
MTNKNQIFPILIVLLIVLSVMLPIISWILSALGLDCKSLLSEEGWRWIFYNIPIACANRWTTLCLCATIGVGSVIRCAILDRKKKEDVNALYLVLIVFVLLLVIILLSALHPHSPLLSITGQLKNSPFIQGLPTVFIWCVIFLSILYAILTHRLKTVGDFSDLLTYGIRRFAPLLVVVMLLSFITRCVSYIFNIIP